MDCPSDGAVLLVAHRSGIEIDICPTCRGVWLDRGELDKLITLAHSRSTPLRPPSLRPFRSKNPATHPPHGPAWNPAAGDSWLEDLFEDPPSPGEGP